MATEEGRADKIGTELPCRWCLMPSLPDGLVAYKETPRFDATSTPKGLTQRHTTRAGSWAEIVVERGRVHYVLEDEDLTFVLTPAHPGVVAPECPHHVDPQTGAVFFVRFLRA